MPRRYARNSMSSINQACGRMFARRTGTSRTPSPPGCSPHQRRCCRLYRPTAAPQRAGHTPVHGLGSGRAPLRAASERARARHPGGRPDAHAIQRTSPVSPRNTRTLSLYDEGTRSLAKNCAPGRLQGRSRATVAGARAGACMSIVGSDYNHSITILRRRVRLCGPKDCRSESVRPDRRVQIPGCARRSTTRLPAPG